MKYAIGLDVGGTKIEGILATETGRVLDRVRIETGAGRPAKEILADIVMVAKKLKKKHVVGVGLSLAGFVVDGKMVFCPNIPSLVGVQIKKVLQARLKLPVAVENDANCFALAEAKYGAAKGKKNVFGVIVGSGVGGGIVIGGKIYSGAKGGAGEFGHNVLTPGEGLRCGQGDLGCIESYCGGKSLLRHYRNLGGRDCSSAEEIFSSQDHFAEKSVEQFYSYLGLGLSHVVNTLNPDIIVLGGGISRSIDIKKLLFVIQKHAIEALGSSVKIAKNKVGASSGSLGAIVPLFEK